MDYTDFFRRNGWATMGRYYLKHPSKIKQLLVAAQKYASKDGLVKVKDELLTICSYVKDIFTGKYKEYDTFHLVVIIGAIVYVVAPIDAVPDFISGGFLDDTAILLWAVKEFAEELNQYKKYKQEHCSEESMPDIMDENVEEIDFEEIESIRQSYMNNTPLLENKDTDTASEEEKNIQ